MSDDGGVSVSVDLSLFTEHDSYGHINGNIRLPLIPSVGDIVSFNHPESDGAEMLMGLVRVEHRTIFANSTSDPLLSLSDVCVKTKDDAVRVARYLEDCFGLFANIHNDEDLRAYIDRGQC